MKALYNRVWLVTIDDGQVQKKYDALDIQFKIAKTSDTTPNELELELYNLNADSRGFIQKLCNIEISAGYTDLNGLIYKGVVEFVGHEKQGTEWVTKVQPKTEQSSGETQW